MIPPVSKVLLDAPSIQKLGLPGAFCVFMKIFITSVNLFEAG
jgi:hypothetical protein